MKGRFTFFLFYRQKKQQRKHKYKIIYFQNINIFFVTVFRFFNNICVKILSINILLSAGHPTKKDNDLKVEWTLINSLIIQKVEFRLGGGQAPVA